MASDELEGAQLRQMSPPFVLAVDVGTSSARAALFDAAGREVEGTLARVEREFRTTPDGGAELNADAAIEDVTRTVDAALAQAEARGLNVEAVAVSCFWHSLVGVDKDARALTPLYGWADTRAANQVSELRRRFDERATHARTGCRFHPSYWPAKLLWLQREQPGIFSRVTRWLTFGELLLSRLCGEQSASVSLASGTGLLDVRRCVWDDELLNGLQLSIDRLPPLAKDGAAFTFDGEFAARWPQLRGRAVWFPAIGDGALNNIGAGCVNQRSVALMIGTSGAMRVLYAGEPPTALPESLWCYRADRRRVVVGGALSDGGGLYDWMKESLQLVDDDEILEREMSRMEPDAHGLTVLPFWAGERSTHWNAHASGAIMGMTTHTRPLDILRASLEAVAYRFAVIADALLPLALPHAEIHASGGALWASRLWSQMLADVLGRPLKLSNVPEASSRGAALLALEALGVVDHLAADAPVEAAEIFEPNMQRHTIYRGALERQETIYQRLHSTNGEMGK